MPIVKTADLIGEALHWATGKADGQPLQIVPAQYGNPARVFVETPSGLVRYRPTTDWLTAGDLMDRHKIDLVTGDDLSLSDRFRRIAVGVKIHVAAPDNRTAICRAVVAAGLGETVDVPEVLL